MLNNLDIFGSNPNCKRLSLTVRSHLNGNTPLSKYLNSVSFKNYRSLTRKVKSRKRDSEEIPSKFLYGTSEMLFLMNLSRLWKKDILANEYILEAWFFLRDSCEGFLDREFNYISNELLGKECAKWFSEVIRGDIEKAFDTLSTDVEKALFLFQMITFFRDEDFSIFKRDWTFDEEDSNWILNNSNATMEIMSKFSQEGELFPRFGESDGGITVNGDLRLGNRLMNFSYSWTREEFLKQSSILKACDLMNGKRMDGFWIYLPRNLQLLELF